MSEYKFTISMNILENLGDNLYNSVPSVIAETIANSYDADADKVEININQKEGTITIWDDGNGMSEEECNEKYLNVGYHKRDSPKGSESPKYHRPVMGRKGIGKLSLFAIANNIEIHSVVLDEDEKIKEKNGFIMNKIEIKNHIKSKRVDKSMELPLKSVDKDRIIINKGTKIILTDLKKDLQRTESFLRTRLARKFSVIGEKYNFKVSINGDEISTGDRNYFDKIQYLWYFGNYGDECLKQCNNLDNSKKISGEIILEDGTKCFVEGWIGTVNERSNLEEGNNTITIHARGKSIHEDLLKDIDNSGFFTKYLIGEVSAEFLDEDNRPDIATSDRQSIQETDERFEKIRDFVRKIMNEIRKQWDVWRNDDSLKKACEIPAIQTWFNSLGPDNKKYAKQIFGKIDKFPIPDEGYKRVLYKNAILAFHTLAVSNNLSKLEVISPEQFEPFLELLSDMDQLEAAHYHEIVRGRMEVLTKFEKLVDANKKEKILQKYIFNHLWLLDPSWERADTKSRRMEESVTKEFGKIKLTEAEKNGRIDIRYRASAGKHIIVELKRYSVETDIDVLQAQIRKYKNALEKCLSKYPLENQDIEIVCILGSKPKNAKPKEILEALKAINARYVTYDQLIKDTLNGYEDYLKKNEKIGEIQKLVESI